VKELRLPSPGSSDIALFWFWGWSLPEEWLLLVMLVPRKFGKETAARRRGSGRPRSVTQNLFQDQASGREARSRLDAETSSA
jgi:hypothetical protein